MTRRGEDNNNLWTNNELLAYKKNVGEEVRLLGNLDRIQRRMILSTSGLNVELRKLHSDLKEVRTSTGRSMEALSPTPFRGNKQYERAELQSSCVSHGDHVQNITAKSTSVEKSLHVSSVWLSKPAVLSNNLLLSSKNIERSEGQLNSSIPERPGKHFSVDFENRDRSNKKWHHHFTHENTSLSDSDAIHKSAHYTEHPKSVSLDKTNRGQYTLTSRLENQSGMERSSTLRCTSPTSPLAKEITEILQSVQEKKEKLSSNGLVAVTSRSKYKPKEQKTKELDNLKPGSKTLTAKLPNIGSKYRMCIERLDENVHQQNSLNLVTSQGTTINHTKFAKPWLMPAKEFNGNILYTTEKMESNKTERKIKSTRKEKENEQKNIAASIDKTDGRACSTVYTSSRLKQLAEPKGGRKPHLHISSFVLRRQAQKLRHSHQQMLLAEYEQQHLLRLQNRVHLFLATLNEQHLPKGMVHIPQRDDIMNVDISHVG